MMQVSVSPFEPFFKGNFCSLPLMLESFETPFNRGCTSEIVWRFSILNHWCLYQKETRDIWKHRNMPHPQQKF